MGKNKRLNAHSVFKWCKIIGKRLRNQCGAIRKDENSGEEPDNDFDDDCDDSDDDEEGLLYDGD